MENKYKVLVIAHQLKNNIIAKSGDVVSESQLNGNAAELVAQNFIIPFNEDDENVTDEQQDEENGNAAELDEKQEVNGIVLPKKTVKK